MVASRSAVLAIISAGSLSLAACGDAPAEEAPTGVTCAAGELRYAGTLNGAPIDERHTMTTHTFVNVEGGNPGRLDAEGPDGSATFIFVDPLTRDGSVPAEISMGFFAPSRIGVSNEPDNRDSTLSLDGDGNGVSFVARPTEGPMQSFEGELTGCFRWE